MEKERAKEVQSNVMMICKECSEQRRKQFQKLNKNKKYKVGDLVKIPIKDGGNVEHFWAEITQKVTQNRFVGRLDNYAVLVTNVDMNDLVEFKKSDIEDIST